METYVLLIKYISTSKPSSEELNRLANMSHQIGKCSTYLDYSVKTITWLIRWRGKFLLGHIERLFLNIQDLSNQLGYNRYLKKSKIMPSLAEMRAR